MTGSAGGVVRRLAERQVSPPEFFRRVGTRLGLLQLRRLAARIDRVRVGLDEETALYPGMRRRLERYEDVACRVAEVRLRDRA